MGGIGMGRLRMGRNRGGTGMGRRAPSPIARRTDDAGASLRPLSPSPHIRHCLSASVISGAPSVMRDRMRRKGKAPKTILIAIARHTPRHHQRDDPEARPNQDRVTETQLPVSVMPASHIRHAPPSYPSRRPLRIRHPRLDMDPVNGAVRGSCPCRRTGTRHRPMPAAAVTGSRLSAGAAAGMTSKQGNPPRGLLSHFNETELMTPESIA